MINMRLNYIIIIIAITLVLKSNLINAAFSQSQESDYLSNFDSIIAASYSAVDDSQSNTPPDLLSQCKKDNINYITPNNVVIVTTSSGNIVTTSDIESQCNHSSICVIPSGITYKVTSSLNVGALIIRGLLEWTDDTITHDSYLCAGYVAVEGNGEWNMIVQQNNAWIYIKDNGAVHDHLRSRAFGAASHNANDYPIITIKGRVIDRTWSLLSKPLKSGDTTMKLLHHPSLMGWSVGDRIAIAPTKNRSQGFGAEFTIKNINADDGTIDLSTASHDDFDAEFIPPVEQQSNPALQSAEVVNLSRSIVITGDDFTHIPCDDSLPEAVGGEQTSTLGCRCASFRTQCTMGLHTAQMHRGVSRISHTRVEKCGQRGVEGKYCLHFHQLKDCPDCLFHGNAIENGQQRGIIVHGTHRSTVEDNVLYNVRGAGIYIEDGNEMYNSISYNVVICNFPFDHAQLHGCTVPGTSNRIADTSDNQTGFYSRGAATNDLIGNRASNSFNGMFLQALGMGRGSDNQGKVCEADSRLGRIIGNVFHSHGRFGTYTLGGTYPKVTDQSIMNDGHNTDLGLCEGFDANGNTRGLSATIKENLDYGNAFVGHYNAGDIQHNGHHSIGNLNLIYWKETKGFQNGCSAHITNGYYANGNMALPDQSTFIIEHTTFGNQVSLEANHHCNVGVTGILCMPQYIIHNVKWNNTVKGRKWVIFPNHNTQGHTANQMDGGIFTLSPSDAETVIQTGNLEGSIFPSGFVSLVSSRFTYLLSIPGEKCVLSTSLGADMGVLYDNGILCKVPLRALKIYSRDQVSGSAANIVVEAWFDRASAGVPDASQEIIYHQIGNDNQTNKQGYSVPVVPGAENTYRLSLTGTNQNIPSDWVIEFSDVVMGNRWTVEYIKLELLGRSCSNGGLVSSHHDRRFLWAGDAFMSSEAWGNHGACVSSSIIPEDMPLVDCERDENNGVLAATECPYLCNETCNENSYCDCGSQICKCRPGFGGPSCSIDLCGAARCGDHGSCAATYLGSSSLLPITDPDNACICEPGWSGHLCQFNPCVTLNKTCSGHGTCVANGDLDAICECDAGFSGDNCEQSCDDFCQGSYPYNCNPNLQDVVLYGCNAFGGCGYKKEGEGELGSSFCVFKQVQQSRCTCQSNNECSIIGPCDEFGQCPQATQLEDGTPCNSVPFGVCKNGHCSESGINNPTGAPTRDPTLQPTRVATIEPTHNPTITATGGPNDCSDSSLRFMAWRKGRKISRTCSWVASKQTPSRCDIDGVSEICASTCGACSICDDTSTRFRFLWKGKMIRRTCIWVAKKKTAVKCAIDGVAAACRSSCGQC